MIKKQSLIFKLWTFLKFLPKMEKKIKCLSIQKKKSKKLIKADLNHKYKCKKIISKLENKKSYMINLH